MDDDDTRNNMDDYMENRKRMFREMNDADKASMKEGFEPPSIEKIMQVIDGLAGVTEEDKEKLRKRIAERAAAAGESVGDFVRKSADSIGSKKPSLPPGFNNNRIKENLISASSDYEMYLFIFMVTMVLLVFGKHFDSDELYMRGFYQRKFLYFISHIGKYSTNDFGLR